MRLSSTAYRATSLTMTNTNLKTIIHPAGPVASAILHCGKCSRSRARNFSTRWVLGVETECRIGNAVYPTITDVGCTITKATAGVFGSAAAVGKLLKLNEQQIDLDAGVSPHRSRSDCANPSARMNKSFNPGRAAPAASSQRCWPRRISTSSDSMIGQARLGQHHQHQAGLQRDLGGPRQRYESALKTTSRSPGHRDASAIDAAIQLRAKQADRRPDRTRRPQGASAGGRTSPARRPRMRP